MNAGATSTMLNTRAIGDAGNAVNTESVLLVGSIPHPIGGVSQHVWRLAGRLAARGCGVCDIHPRPTKYPLPGVRHRQAPTASWKKLLWLLSQLRNTPASVVHFHGSIPGSLAIAGQLLLRACGRRRTVVTLHHGDLETYFQRLTGWRQRMTAACLRRHDSIICLSARQRQFYAQTIGVPSEQLIDATSYIALPHEWAQQFSASTDATTAASPDVVTNGTGNNNRERLLVASGYAEPYYRHEDAIWLVDQLRHDGPAQLAICLYGESQDGGYLQRLQQMAAQRPHVKLHYRLEFPQFLRLLSSADLLVRPTEVDSYGLVVADALAVGVPAVATDVCRRHPAAVVYRAGDANDLLRAARQALTKSLHGSTTAISDADDALPAILQAYGPSFSGAAAQAKRRAS